MEGSRKGGEGEVEAEVGGKKIRAEQRNETAE